MLKLLLIICGLAVVSISLVGCMNAKTTVYPMAHDTYQVVSLSSDEGDANKASLAKAAKICKASGKQVAVKNTKTLYQGIDKSKAALMDMASDVISIFAHGSVGGANRNNDYQNVMT